VPAWLPTSGLVREHHDYGVYATDAPAIYHAASILTTISTACADTAVLILDGAPHALNIWTMIVGQSSVDRKTTATRLAVDRLEAVLERRIQRIFGSPEGFISALQDEPTSLLYISEGASFFEQRDASYWRHAKGMFMDLYDYSPMFRRRLAKTELVIEHPRLSILSACALTLLDHHSKLTDWLGGFLPRFLMIMGDKTEFLPATRADKTAEKSIEDQIFNIHNHNWGPISISSLARQTLEQFSYEIYQDLSAYPDNLHPALNRLPEASLRLAAIYEIASQAAQVPRGVLMVTNTSAQHAVALCRESRDVALLRLAELAEGNGVSRELMNIETLVRRSSLAGVSRSDILRGAHIHADHLDRIIHTLVERDSITVGSRPSKRGPQRTVYIHAQARADQVRASRNQAIDPEPTAFIAVLDLSQPDDLRGVAELHPDEDPGNDGEGDPNGPN